MPVYYKGYKVTHYTVLNIGWSWFAKKQVGDQTRTAVGNSYKELKDCIENRERIWNIGKPLISKTYRYKRLIPKKVKLTNYERKDKTGNG